MELDDSEMSRWCLETARQVGTHKIAAISARKILNMFKLGKNHLPSSKIREFLVKTTMFDG
jgi:hypothetical protein